MEMGNFALIIVDRGFMFVAVLCFSVYWMTFGQTISGQGSIFWMRKYHLQILVSFYDQMKDLVLRGISCQRVLKLPYRP